jgi:hypothetical protein
MMKSRPRYVASAIEAQPTRGPRAQRPGEMPPLTQQHIVRAWNDQPVMGTTGQGAGHAETAPAGPTRPAAGEGASLNASADGTLFRWPVTTCAR